MSRIGKKIIEIPDGVEIQLNNRELNVNGSLGAESISLMDGLDCKVEDKVLTVVKTGDENDKKLTALHGLFRSLIKQHSRRCFKRLQKRTRNRWCWI